MLHSLGYCLDGGADAHTATHRLVAERWLNGKSGDIILALKKRGAVTTPAVGTPRRPYCNNESYHDAIEDTKDTITPT